MNGRSLSVKGGVWESLLSYKSRRSRQSRRGRPSLLPPSNKTVLYPYTPLWPLDKSLGFIRCRSSVVTSLDVSRSVGRAPLELTQRHKTRNSLLFPQPSHLPSPCHGLTRLHSEGRRRTSAFLLRRFLCVFRRCTRGNG